MNFDTILSIALGIGLAAGTGFRVFLPLFALSVSAYFGVWPLNENWQWLASTNALIILGIAAITESLSYLIPFVDNLLDTIAVPLAGLAGTAVMASTAADLSPAVTWALAIIAGGGAAAKAPMPLPVRPVPPLPAAWPTRYFQLSKQALP